MINKTFFIHLLSHQYAKFAGYFVTGLCSLWIILKLIQTSTIIFYPVSVKLPNTDPPHNSIQPQLITNIPNWHLFGQAPITPINEQNVPLSSLNLTLNGIFYQKNHKKSQAIITDMNGNAKLYKVGDIVPGGVTLYDILTNSVIVESNGQLEKITLLNQNLQFTSPPQGLP